MIWDTNSANTRKNGMYEETIKNLEKAKQILDQRLANKTVTGDGFASSIANLSLTDILSATPTNKASGLYDYISTLKYVGSADTNKMVAEELYTVVVADDEPGLREAVCSLIRWEEIGFRLVGSAGNGLDALQMVEQLQPDLLLTDIQMPFISGTELAKSVREIQPLISIAFLSVD